MTHAERLVEIADNVVKEAELTRSLFTDAYDDIGDNAGTARLNVIAAQLRALAQELEKERAFLEAAEKASVFVDAHFPNPEDRYGAEEGDLLVFAMVDAYRALLAERKGSE